MWLDDLRPAFGDVKFFYEDELARLSKNSTVSSGQAHPLRAHTDRDDLPGKQRGNDAFEAGRVLNGVGRGICLAGGTGDMQYHNDVIPPAPVGRQDQ